MAGRRHLGCLAFRYEPRGGRGRHVPAHGVSATRGANPQALSGSQLQLVLGLCEPFAQRRTSDRLWHRRRGVCRASPHSGNGWLDTPSQAIGRLRQRHERTGCATSPAAAQDFSPCLASQVCGATRRDTRPSPPQIDSVL